MTFAEVWKPISGYEGLYEVSTFGNIKRILPYRGIGGKMKVSKDKKRGYLLVVL